MPKIRGRVGAWPAATAASDMTKATASTQAEQARPLHRFFLTFKPPRGRDAERFHLSVEVAPLHAEDLGGPRHVALLLGERPEDQIALEPVARFVQRQPLGRRGAGFGVRRG